MATLPTRTSTSTSGEHLTDHNTLHTLNNQLGSFVQATTAPTNPAVGDLWLDTTAKVLKRYDGTSWVSFGGSGGGGATWTPADTAAGAHADDEEMTAALDAAWTWQASSGTPTADNSFANWADTQPTVPRYSINGYMPGQLVIQPLSAGVLKMYRTMPATGFGAATRWVVGAKMRLSGGITLDDRVSFNLENAAPTAARDEPMTGVHLQFRRDSGNNYHVRNYVSQGGAVQGGGTSLGSSGHSTTVYFAIGQRTTNVLHSWCSLDGVGWVSLNAFSGFTINGAVSHIYLAVADNGTDTPAATGMVDWVRFRTGTNDPNALWLT